jgi:hypothetical protein
MCRSYQDKGAEAPSQICHNACLVDAMLLLLHASQQCSDDAALSEAYHEAAQNLSLMLRAEMLSPSLRAQFS